MCRFSLGSIPNPFQISANTRSTKCSLKCSQIIFHQISTPPSFGSTTRFNNLFLTLLFSFSPFYSCFFCGSTIIFYFLVDGSSRWVVLQAGPAVAVELHSHQFPVAVWLLVELCQLAMRPRRGAAEAPCGGLCTDRLFVFRTIRAVGCF